VASGAQRTAPGAEAVVILCGGRGTRAYPETEALPKPLLPIGDAPILDHVMSIYAAQGHRRFVLATGYLGEAIAEHYARPPAGWDVRVVATGDETPTGERLRQAAAYTEGERLFATYGDGLGDVSLSELLASHEHAGARATLTTVPLPSPYGTVATDAAGRVTGFTEKPRLYDHWINAGFFCFDRSVFELWHGDDLEREVLPSLAEAGVLSAYRHEGFWRSLDTIKDRAELDALARQHHPPWHVADGAPASPTSVGSEHR
jgi:glucose-1-phosphate cytidylyltransferase